MNSHLFASDDGRMVRTYEYDDGAVLAADLGPIGADATVDVVDGTVIVVADGDQQEFDLPDWTTDQQAFIRNGVLTVEMEGHR